MKMTAAHDGVRQLFNSTNFTTFFGLKYRHTAHNVYASDEEGEEKR